MSYFGKNIKKIRAIKKLSQTAFADIFSLTRAAVGAYEEGRAEAKIDTIISIANHFSLTVDVLLRKELTVNELYHFDVFKAASNAVSNPKKLKQPQADIHLMEDVISFVPVSYIQNYLQRYKQNHFIKQLPTLKFPFQSEYKLRAFEQQTCEMSFPSGGIKQGDVVLVEQVSSDEIIDGKIYLLISTAGVYLRQILKKEKPVATAYNPDYKPITLDSLEILELWQVRAYFSKIISKPPELEARISRLEQFLYKTEA